MKGTFADRIEMQNRLFSELSRMFGKEVPLYDKSLEVNRVCNRAVCDLLEELYGGFEISHQQVEKTSGERHGAIRIGRPDEYQWIGRFFAAFGMEPVNFYDMTSVGSKSQPITATAFRSIHNPEHRIFTSLLQTTYFDPATKARIEALLAQRQVFGEKAKTLIKKCEAQGGLDWEDATALIAEGTQRIFKWTGKACDYALYKDLCDSGFKIAADIACFQSHHLNHLTPNTFCMDLYTSAMHMCMGEIDEREFRTRATRAMERTAAATSKDRMRLLFRHLTPEDIDGFKARKVDGAFISALVDRVTKRLQMADLKLTAMKHAGFKDYTEGPAQDTPVLLRQDAYKALTEPVTFENPDGSMVNSVHTARFGEIEQRFYATTPKGRELYDKCLSEADAAKDKDPGLIKRDFTAYEVTYAKPFAPFPKTLSGLIDEELVYGLYSPTRAGLARVGTITTTSIRELVEQGLAQVEGLRYEDFLPVSAAGIFASNLNQYGTKSTAVERPKYTQRMLEEVLGKKIVDADAMYYAMQSRSILETLRELGVLDRLNASNRKELEKQAAALEQELPQRPHHLQEPAGV